MFKKNAKFWSKIQNDPLKYAVVTWLCLNQKLPIYELKCPDRRFIKKKREVIQGIGDGLRDFS